MQVLITKPKGLGLGLLKLLRQQLGKHFSTSTAKLKPYTKTMILRWGSTKTISLTPYSTHQLNTPQAIRLVANKRLFRQAFQATNSNFTLPLVTPHSITLGIPTSYPLVLRPAKHQMGGNFHVCHNEEELLSSAALYPDWYASPLIDKVAEYRVFVMQGRVVWVAQKIPHDPSAIVWNVSQDGSEFVNVKWGNWPLDVCEAAISACITAELDFGGVDVIVERDTNRPYVLEINSAPSHPFLSDGSVSYRQQCLCSAIAHILDNEDTSWFPIEDYTNWKNIIHPGIYIP